MLLQYITRNICDDGSPICALLQTFSGEINNEILVSFMHHGETCLFTTWKNGGNLGNTFAKCLIVCNRLLEQPVSISSHYLMAVWCVQVFAQAVMLSWYPSCFETVTAMMTVISRKTLTIVTVVIYASKKGKSLVFELTFSCVFCHSVVAVQETSGNYWDNKCHVWRYC